MNVSDFESEYKSKMGSDYSSISHAERTAANQALFHAGVLWERSLWAGPNDLSNGIDEALSRLSIWKTPHERVTAAIIIVTAQEEAAKAYMEAMTKKRLELTEELAETVKQIKAKTKTEQVLEEAKRAMDEGSDFIADIESRIREQVMKEFGIKESKSNG